jgi:hypothetical protein
VNYLQLCQRVRQEGGIAGTGPATVLNQTGEYLRLANWVAGAWDEIQEMRSTWLWMHGDFSFTTTPSVGVYTPAVVGLTDWRWWDRKSFKIYDVAKGLSDQGRFGHMSHQTWSDTFDVNQQTDDRPQKWTERPEDGAIILGPVPDVPYVVSGQYWKAQTHLVNDTDIPAMPGDYHLAIVWRALMMYYQFEEAPAQFDFAREWHGRWIIRLESNQLQPMDIGARPVGNLEYADVTGGPIAGGFVLD